MHRLLERLDHTVYDVVSALLGPRDEGIALIATRLEDLLAVGLDVLARSLEALLGALIGLLAGLGDDFVCLLASLGDDFVCLLAGLGDDFVRLALGFLDALEYLCLWHYSVVRMYREPLFGSCGNDWPGSSGGLSLLRSQQAPMGVLEDKARARTFYKYLSTVYDRINPFVWDEGMRDAAIGMLDLGPDDRVLDVGCGTGFATEGLLEHTERVYGLDQSPHQLQKAYAKFGRRGPVRFHLGDAERLPFADDAFDVVWSSGSIEYWPNPVETLRELRRVARPGGQVLVVGPDSPDRTLFQKLADAIMLFYDEEEADRMFEAAGYEAFEHHIQQSRPGSPRAITTLAAVPE
jgi:ubiquinone/menaquinone biosynthesis C-methylase UbiE